MIDIEAAIFSRIAKEFDKKFAGGSRYNEPNPTPAKFPCLQAYRSDRAWSGYAGLDGERIVFDVDAYSNLVSGGKQQCKDMLEIAEDVLLSFGAWELVFVDTVPNIDNRIYRMKARYRAVAVQESDEDSEYYVRIYRR